MYLPTNRRPKEDTTGSDVDVVGSQYDRAIGAGNRTPVNGPVLILYAGMARRPGDGGLILVLVYG
jgi:hypothetical protein